MEGRDEDININVDPFDDSYARDTSVDELKEILNRMETTQPQNNIPLDPHTLHKVESHLQAKIDSGYTAPYGWLFRGLIFFFSSAVPTTGGHETFDKTHTEDIALCLARNTARFASAHIATSFKDPDVTHVIVNPDTSSREDIASLRGSLAARPGKKIPHLVSLHWIQESWKNGTLLDEESTYDYLYSFL
ncbi:DNA ligase 4 [Penicillium sp. IBT 18751x]|nr:DNA ligase 4 [Penicillium sp. IBT 18751x]